MEKTGENEQLINKLIKKRKQENDAFIKLLNAIEIKTGATLGKSKSQKNKD